MVLVFAVGLILGIRDYHTLIGITTVAGLIATGLYG